MFSSLKFLAIAAVLAGITNGQLPSCAQNCVTKFTSGANIGSCSNIDAVCICSNKGFLSGIACCLASICDEADQEAATAYAQNFCKAAGVTGLPTAVSCASTAAFTATPPPSSSSSSSFSSATGATGAVTSTSSSVSSTESSASQASQHSSSSASSTSTSVSSAKSSGPAAATKNVGLGAGVLGGLAVAVALL